MRIINSYLFQHRSAILSQSSKKDRQVQLADPGTDPPLCHLQNAKTLEYKNLTCKIARWCDPNIV